MRKVTVVMENDLRYKLPFWCWLYLCNVNFCLYSPFFKFWYYDHDFENTSEIDYFKIMILHGKIFMLFSQSIFSILSHFQCADNINKFFWNSLDKGLKKQKGFLSSGISSDILSFFFYVSAFISEEIFCWIAWVTFRRT